MESKYVMQNMYVESVKNQRDLLAYPCSLSWLKRVDLEVMLQLQELVVATLEDPDLYVPLSPDEFAAIFEGKGLALGAYVQEQLIGFRIVLFPGEHEDNLGRDLGFATEQLQQVIHLEAVTIHPDYRGNGLQRLLTKLMIDHLSRVPSVRYLLLTVSPYNLPSMINSFRNGLYIVKLTHKYNQRLRYIFYRDIAVSPVFDEQRARAISNMDIKQQLELLDQDYYGYKLDSQADQPVILYAKQRIIVE